MEVPQNANELYLNNLNASLLLCLVIHYDFWKHTFFGLRNHRTTVQVLNSDDMEQKSSSSHRVREFQFSQTAVFFKLRKPVGYKNHVVPEKIKLQNKLHHSIFLGNLYVRDGLNRLLPLA